MQLPRFVRARLASVGAILHRQKPRLNSGRQARNRRKTVALELRTVIADDRADSDCRLNDPSHLDGAVAEAGLDVVERAFKPTRPAVFPVEECRQIGGLGTDKGVGADADQAE